MGSSENAATKKVSGSAKGLLILVLLVVAAWAIFKIITPGNFGSPKNMLSYFEASLMVATGAVGFLATLGSNMSPSFVRRHHKALNRLQKLFTFGTKDGWLDENFVGTKDILWMMDSNDPFLGNNQ